MDKIVQRYQGHDIWQDQDGLFYYTGPGSDGGLFISEEGCRECIDEYLEWLADEADRQRVAYNNARPE